MTTPGENVEAAGPPPARWKVWAALAWVALQLLAPPAMVLAADHLPTIFAWQMFSRGTPRVRFVVTFDDGRTILFAPRDVVIKDRGDIPFATLLPAKLCARDGAVSVRTLTATGESILTCD